MEKRLIRALLGLVLLAILGGCISMEEVQGIAGGLPKGTAQPLDEKTIIAGLKEALTIGTKEAVKLVSARDGYYSNQAIKILLPPELKEWEKKLRNLGLGNHIDDFIENMNRAAEEAAPEAGEIFADALREMTLNDARRILEGPGDAATRYFEEKTRGRLYTAFTPVIHAAMQEVGLTRLFEYLLDTYNKIPLVKKIRFKIDEYVGNKALDGLFLMLAEEEEKIRKDPAARVTDLLRKVFG